MNSPLAIRAARKSMGVGTGAGPSGNPMTPRARFVQTATPETSPSSPSSSSPHDWRAIRGGKKFAYSTPERPKQPRKSGTHNHTPTTTPRRVIRKKSLKEKIQSIPSDIMFHIYLFPDNIPLPKPEIGARALGGFMHILHFLIRVASSRKAIEDAAPWDDYSGADETWFDWTIPISTALLLVSFYTTFRLFSSFKSYDLHLQKDPVASPRATFISTKLDREPVEGPTFTRRVLSWMVYSWSISWRFLLNMKMPVGRLENVANPDRVQRLNMWHPGELELHLFVVYSPVHALLWMATNFSNWILMMIIMGIVSTQAHLLTTSYTGLVKDKTILAGEVLHEYNVKFVNPRVFPLRFDKGVMTNQAEYVDGWS